MRLMHALQRPEMWRELMDLQLRQLARSNTPYIMLLSPHQIPPTSWKKLVFDLPLWTQESRAYRARRWLWIYLFFWGGYKNKRINNAEHQRWEELGRVPGWHLHCVVLRKPLKLSVVKMKETAAAADSWRAFPSDLRCMHAPLSSSYATPSCFSVKQVYICRWTYF